MTLFILIMLPIGITGVIYEYTMTHSFSRPGYLFLILFAPFILVILQTRFYKFAFNVSALCYCIIFTISILAGKEGGDQLVTIPGLILFVLFFTSKRITLFTIIYAFCLSIIYYIKNHGQLYLTTSYFLDNITAVAIVSVLSILLVHTLERSLIEKNQLIKEIHHRVKNNLQMISSLLFLQSNNQKYNNSDNQNSNIIKSNDYIEFQQRVLSIAKVHERLYNSDDFYLISLYEVLTDIEKNLIQVFENTCVQFVHTLEVQNFNLQTTVPLTLILNELITNSLKHNHKQTDLTITISLIASQEESYTLIVSDNGCGFSDLEKIDSISSLGVLLVNMLVIQLNGDITFSNSDGANIKLLFHEIAEKTPAFYG